MKLLRILAAPFALIYWMITSFRNHLYNIGQKKSFQFEINVIAVGNLTVGGTGKTPHIEYLINLLTPNFKLITLSRGYGRKTKGYIVADVKTKSHDIGDEPMQLYLKHGDKVKVTVDEQRARAIPEILHQFEDTQVILLDDAYQHRSVKPNFNILLCNYHRPFYKDYVMPMGLLRESRAGAKRADVVIVTKCPSQLSSQEKDEIKKKITVYTRDGIAVFFSTINYLPPKPVGAAPLLEKDSKVTLVSAIANDTLLIKEVEKSYDLVKTFTFMDHYKYSMKDIERFKGYKNIITTEKDMVKLREFDLEGINLYYLPIEITIMDEKEKFDSLVKSSIH